ncbi:MAG: GNAT family N-acetyltransferase, partial [Oscillospiraceae bacterium]|nr:GNAT family N-acetyltransferase [Oscillospiraceae bacterium]
GGGGQAQHCGGFGSHFLRRSQIQAEIFVREEYRGRGIGGTAIQQMWDALQEQGLETMYLEVVPSNEAALRLYHKLGFCNLNTLTLNRSVKKKSQLGTETICGLPFKTYRPHQG